MKLVILLLFCTQLIESARGQADVYEIPTGTDKCEPCENFDKENYGFLFLRCVTSTTSKQAFCKCQIDPWVADTRYPLWKVTKSDAVNKICAVGKLGPCGEKNGIKIECHGDGLSCKKNTCVGSTLAGVGDSCEDSRHCATGLICNKNNRKCIKANSIKHNEDCSDDDNCVKGLKCVTLSAGHEGPIKKCCSNSKDQTTKPGEKLPCSSAAGTFGLSCIMLVYSTLLVFLISYQ